MPLKKSFFLAILGLYSVFNTTAKILPGSDTQIMMRFLDYMVSKTPSELINNTCLDSIKLYAHTLPTSELDLLDTTIEQFVNIHSATFIDIAQETLNKFPADEKIAAEELLTLLKKDLEFQKDSAVRQVSAPFNQEFFNKVITAFACYQNCIPLQTPSVAQDYFLTNISKKITDMSIVCKNSKDATQQKALCCMYLYIFIHMSYYTVQRALIKKNRLHNRVLSAFIGGLHTCKKLLF